MKRKLLSLGTALFLSSVGANLAWAANFQLSSAGNNIVLDGVYISPYTALINGVSTTVICDDFADEVSIGETWQATVSTVASLSPNVKWATDSDPLVQPYPYNEQQSYNEAAWLTGQLLATSDPTQMGEISYAIWAVFDPTGVQNWLNSYHDTTTYNAIWGSGGLLSQAASQTYYPGEFSNVSVYTPMTGTQSCCGPPQEFLAVQTVRTDEASTIATFGFDFTCLAVLLYFFRRRLSAKLN